MIFFSEFSCDNYQVVPSSRMKHGFGLFCTRASHPHSSRNTSFTIILGNVLRFDDSWFDEFYGKEFENGLWISILFLIFIFF